MSQPDTRLKGNKQDYRDITLLICTFCQFGLSQESSHQADKQPLLLSCNLQEEGVIIELTTSFPREKKQVKNE